MAKQLEAMAKDRDWFSLAQFADGQLLGFRRRTWWSTEPIPTNGVVPAAYRRGMPNDWLGLHSVVLRAEASGVQSTALTPSAVDGYHSPVFFPSSEDSHSGWSIDLSKIDDPRSKGAVEIVFESVSAGLIHVQLISIPPDQKHSRMSLDELQVRLLNYYEAEILPE